MKRMAKSSVLAGAACALGIGIVTACKTRTFQAGGARVNVKVRGTGISQPFDVNDVSILLPRKVILDTDSLKMDAFISNDAFQAILDVSNNPQMTAFAVNSGTDAVGFSNVALKKANWRIVSIRVDTCAPGAHFAATLAQGDKETRDLNCIPQVRLVAQPFSKAGNDEDTAVHLLYQQSKSTESLKTLLQSFDAVRNASNGSTAGVPLGEHPGLKNETTRAAVLQKVTELLTLHTKADNLRSLAVMALATDAPEPWIFFAMNRGQDAKMNLFSIPTVDKALRSTEDRTDKGFFQALSFATNTHVLGLPSNTPQRAVFDSDGRPVDQAPTEAIQVRSTRMIFDESDTFDPIEIGPLDKEKVDLLHKIDHPDNIFFSMDCVSCHTNGNLLMRRLAFLGDAPSAERELLIAGSPGVRFKIPKGITGYADRDTLPKQASFGLPWSVRNFGYFNGQPTINSRTVAESAEVVHEINVENLELQNLEQQINGPNACGNLTDDQWSAVEPQLWTCMNFGSEPAKACLERLCPAAPAAAADIPAPAPAAVSFCAEPFQVEALQQNDALFVLSILPAAPLAQGPTQTEKRSRAVILEGTGQAGTNFTKRADFVHGRNRNRVVRTKLDFAQESNSQIKIRHRIGSAGTLEAFVLPNNGTVNLEWNCNRYEGSFLSTRIFVAKSEESFPTNANGLRASSPLPIELPRK